MNSRTSTRVVVRSSGITLGAVIALALSWMTNHSVIWAILHALCGWWYIIYRIAGCGGDMPTGF